MHVVGSGENLSTIAQRYGLTLQELSNYNGIANPNMVFVGQQLGDPRQRGGAASHGAGTVQCCLADDGYYTVARGETLSLVARNHGMTTADLMRLNGISDANQIWVGQQLRVSARVPAVAQPAAAQPPTAGRRSHLHRATRRHPGAIADREQTSVQQLLAANGLPAADFVYPGQHLRVRPA